MYIDDLLLTNSDFETHVKTLDSVFRKFKDNDLRFSAKKCFIAQAEIEHFSMILSTKGVRIAPKRFHALTTYPAPRSTKEVRRLIGFHSYFRRFIRNFSIITADMRQLLKANAEFKWTSQLQKDLDQLKKAVESQATLIYPDWTKPFHIIIFGGCGCVERAV